MEINIFHPGDFDQPDDQNKIGEGAQGTVHKLQETKTQKTYAVKIFQDETSLDSLI